MSTTRVAGHFRDGRQSRRLAGTLVATSNGLRVEGVPGVGSACTPLAGVRISSRLGNTPRTLRFPDGSSFETDDNDAIDRITRGPGRFHGLAHRLESRWRYVLAGLATTLVVAWATVQWGVPAVAHHIAHALPAQVNDHTDRLTMEILDRQYLSPTKLDITEQRRLLAVFQPFLDEHTDTFRLRVLFRDGGDNIGANALALPAGTMVLTDQLVRMAEHDEELVAIVAHEIGHVVHRHALRRGIQASITSVLVILLVGDVSSISSLATALPVLLTELGYSRRFEHEADDHAVDTLLRHGIPPERLASILKRLDPRDSDDHGYLSTHPPTPERISNITGANR